MEDSYTNDMKKILIFLAAAAALCSCKNDNTVLLPNVSGKAGEIIVVIDKSDWEGALGDEVRDMLASECPYLAQQEPLYSLVNVTPSAFADLFRVHRNIMILNVNPQVDSAGIIYQHDVWARTQCVIQVNGQDSDKALEVLRAKKENILNSFEQAERNRVIANSIRYEERAVSNQVMEVFGGSPHIPIGYKLRKISGDFAWIEDNKQYSTQGVFVYRYPVDSENPLTEEKILEKRNDTLKENVPGMFDNTWMVTSESFPITLKYIKYRNRQIAEMRGYWEVQNDFMGGPFVSHSFYSEDGQYIYVLEAWVYAPKYDKRQYLRQTESILYSWEWNKQEEEK